MYKSWNEADHNSKDNRKRHNKKNKNKEELLSAFNGLILMNTLMLLIYK